MYTYNIHNIQYVYSVYICIHCIHICIQCCVSFCTAQTITRLKSTYMPTKINLKKVITDEQELNSSILPLLSVGLIVF